jgi:hypothetical protein
MALPGRVGHAGTNDSMVTSPLAGGGEPASTAPATAYTQDEEWAAYFAAGYDYNDAQRLAQLWNDSGSIGQVKAEAGQMLLEGQTLPVAPTGTPEDPTEKAQSAFFAAGYDYDDAVTLGNMWHDSDITQVKTDAGQKLLDGQILPIRPSGPSASAGASGGVAVTPAAPTKQDDEVQAFFAAGYTYDDAVTLSNVWHESDTYQVKADAGQKLLDGKTLPIAPSGTPESQSQKATGAFFAAGYDYDDAVTLGKMWHETDLGKVKADAGRKLIEGQKLPIAP